MRSKAESVLKKAREVEVVLKATPALQDWVPPAVSRGATEAVAELEMQLADMDMHTGPDPQPCVFDDLFRLSEQACSRANEKIASLQNYVKDGEKGMAETQS